ncbi:MAG: hypothetical protein WAZ34_08340, partial [Rhodocyclaceae bacterium]
PNDRLISRIASLPRRLPYEWDILSYRLAHCDKMSHPPVPLAASSSMMFNDLPRVACSLRYPCVATPVATLRGGIKQ